MPNILSPYTIKDTNLYLTSKDGVRIYDLKIRDFPIQDRPREKMLQSGAQSLSIQELMSVVLNTGTKKEDVLSMSNRIIREYGHNVLSSEFDPLTLSEKMNIPIGKACQIVACSEIGRRFYKRDGVGLAVIRTAEDVYNYLGDMRQLPKEQLRGIYLDTHNRVIYDEVISMGTVNSNLAHPREVFRPALEHGAVAVVLAHNHPSGILSPSQADIDVTAQLVAAGQIIGINVLDHVIVSKEGYHSIEADYSA